MDFISYKDGHDYKIFNPYVFNQPDVDTLPSWDLITDEEKLELL